MHVFKAAVVGAGTMGGEIAQVIAAAGVPVVLKDVEQKFVDQGLEKAREVSRNQLGGLVKKEKISQEQADSQLEEQGLVHGEWEHPERRSRRYYSLTNAGRREYRRLVKEVRPLLESIGRSIEEIVREVYGK